MWVDAAIKLEERDLKMMDRLVRAQQRNALENAGSYAVAARHASSRALGSGGRRRLIESRKGASEVLNGGTAGQVPVRCHRPGLVAVGTLRRGLLFLSLQFEMGVERGESPLDDLS